jgi:hypothetical protein
VWCPIRAGGSLDPMDVASETSDSKHISHHWGGNGVGGPEALGGQTTHFALRYSGRFQFDGGACAQRGLHSSVQLV